MSERANRAGRRMPARVDPRAEPESVPPPARADIVGPAADHAGVDAAVANQTTGERPVAPGARRSEVGVEASLPELPTPEATPRSVVSVADPRFAQIDPLLARSDWEGIRRALGPIESAGALPPGLALLLALAHKELIQGPAAQRDETPENDVAIRCVSRLLGVPGDSAAALVIAKRLLRRNPAGWRARPAPRGWASTAIVVLGIALGAVLGYALAFGPWGAGFGGAPGSSIRRAVSSR